MADTPRLSGLSDSALTELARLAGEAQPGPWGSGSFYDSQRRPPSHLRAKVWSADEGPCDVAYTVSPEDARFIAATDPATVTAIVAELLSLRGEVAAVEAMCEETETRLVGDGGMSIDRLWIGKIRSTLAVPDRGPS